MFTQETVFHSPILKLPMVAFIPILFATSVVCVYVQLHSISTVVYPHITLFGMCELVFMSGYLSPL